MESVGKAVTSVRNRDAGPCNAGCSALAMELTGAEDLGGGADGGQPMVAGGRTDLMVSLKGCSWGCFIVKHNLRLLSLVSGTCHCCVVSLVCKFCTGKSRRVGPAACTGCNTHGRPVWANSNRLRPFFGRIGLGK